MTGDKDQPIKVALTQIICMFGKAWRNVSFVKDSEKTL